MGKFKLITSISELIVVNVSLSFRRKMYKMTHIYIIIYFQVETQFIILRLDSHNRIGLYVFGLINISTLSYNNFTSFSNLNKQDHILSKSLSVLNFPSLSSTYFL